MDVDHLIVEHSVQNVHECNSGVRKQGATSSTEEDEIVDHLVGTPAIFKSQQKHEPELTVIEKKHIAQKMIKEDCYLFLSKFGHYLKKEHLDYFEKKKGDNYEISYHINKLKRYFNNNQRQMDIKNRRFMALKSLIEKGEYFSECEMMKRNPLLYEHLVGQYLTEDQKKTRDNINRKDITYANILMEMNDRERQRNLYNAQKDEETDEQLHDNELEDDSEQECDLELSTSPLRKTYRWGEVYDEKNVRDATQNSKLINLQSCHKISNAEKQLLRQEFLTSMYQSFLDGKDLDFDYSTVDYNEAYDNMDLHAQDEEEKYFDSECPETIPLPNNNPDQNQSEDELDVYMKSLEVE